VKSKELVSDQVVAWCETCGNSACPLEVCENIVRSPGGSTEGRCCHALLVNLEPAFTITRARGEITSTLEHPNHDWTLRMCPLLPYGSDLRASSHRSTKRRASSSVTSNFSVRNCQGRIVIWPLSFDRRGGLGWTEACVSRICRSANDIRCYSSVR